MSFGSAWCSFRNAVEAEILATFHSIEPAAKALVVEIAEEAAAKVLATGGTPGDRFVAARNLVEGELAAKGIPLAEATLSAVVKGALAHVSATTPTPPQA